MKRTITLLAVAVLALGAAAIAANRQDELLTVALPSPDAAPPTASEKIITGVCTFGECPVSTTAPQETETEATEPVTFPEEEPEEPVWQGCRTVTCWVTAYCGCDECSEGYGNMTATGKTVQPNHTVAVDPNVIPYGTKVEINGTVYTAEDCGGGVNGYSIDVYFTEHRQCEAWATGYYEVTIY